MKKNIWENVAKALGISLEREFTIEEYGSDIVYKFTKHGLIQVDIDEAPPSIVLPQLLSGELSITPKPWKPKVGDKYYHVEESINGELYIETIEWNNDMTDYCAYRCGNCFASEEEANAQMYKLRSTLCEYYSKSENVGEDVKKRIQEILRPNHMEKVAEVLGVKIGETFSVRFGEYIDNQREFDGDCYLDDEGLHIVGQDRTQSVLLEKLLNGNAYIEREANNE